MLGQRPERAAAAEQRVGLRDECPAGRLGPATVEHQAGEPGQPVTAPPAAWPGVHRAVRAARRALVELVQRARRAGARKRWRKSASASSRDQEPGQAAASRRCPGRSTRSSRRAGCDRVRAREVRARATGTGRVRRAPAPRTSRTGRRPAICAQGCSRPVGRRNSGAASAPLTWARGRSAAAAASGRGGGPRAAASPAGGRRSGRRPSSSSVVRNRTATPVPGGRQASTNTRPQRVR